MELVRDNWTKNDYDDFIEELCSYADEKYRSFHSSLIPDNDKDFFIGVRMPVMRKLGKEISKGNGRSFLEQTTDNSYEEKIIVFKNKYKEISEKLHCLVQFLLF